MHAPLPWHERQHPRAAPAFDKEGPLAGRVQVQSVERKAMQRAERELLFLSSIASHNCLSAVRAAPARKGLPRIGELWIAPLAFSGVDLTFRKGLRFWP